MAKDCFTFKQFVVHQDRCTMKVGTDGTLLGAWAAMERPDGRVLDIGTGTGLMALMMAQRYPAARVTAIDIDQAAVEQAADNVMKSPFADRIEVCQADVNTFEAGEGYDAIVCNPPYFMDALTCPEAQRTMARHATTLNYKSLAEIAKKLLKPHAVLSVVIPVEYEENLESAVTFEGLFVSRVCQIKTTPNKLPKRLLMEIRKQPVDAIDFTEQVLEISPGIRSDWYHELTKDFYIK
jgi:tRNA1Val (adenine37-N6)-methyltransferase